MFSFSSFYKNSLDWVGQKRSQLLGAWRCVLDASLSVTGCRVTGCRAALQSTCSLKNRTNKACRGRDPAERDSPSSWALHSWLCKHCRGALAITHSAHAAHLGWECRPEVRKSEFSPQSSVPESVLHKCGWVLTEIQARAEIRDGGEVRSICCLIRQEEQGAAFPPLHQGLIHHSAHPALGKWQRNPWIPGLEWHSLAWMFSPSAVLWPLG